MHDITDTAVEGSRFMLQTLLSAAPAPKPDPLRVAMNRLVMDLAKLEVPRLPVTCHPAHFERVAIHLFALAEVVDRYVAAVGVEVNANAPTVVDQKLFQNQLLGALDGNAIWACNNAAEVLTEERATLSYNL